MMDLDIGLIIQKGMEYEKRAPTPKLARIKVKGHQPNNWYQYLQGRQPNNWY
eukprot:UN09768